MSTSASNRPQNVSRRGRHARGTSSSRPEFQAPLLFRFPAVDQAASVTGTHDNQIVTDATSAESEMSVTPEAQVAEAALSESVYSDNEPNRTAAYSVAPAPEVRTSTLTADESGTTDTEDLTESEADDKATWWEHWSSGVVLLLLVAALVTAGIAAFNDQSTTKDDLLAIEGAQKDAAEGGDLTDLDIPLGNVTSAPAYPADHSLANVGNAEESIIPSIGESLGGLEAPLAIDPGLDLPGGSQELLLGGAAADSSNAESLVSNEEIEQALSQATLGLPEQQASRPMFNDSSSTGTPDTQMQPIESILGMQPAGTAGGTPPLPTPTDSEPKLGYPGMGVGATTVSHAVPVNEPVGTNVQPAIRETQTPASDEQELLRRFQEWRKSQQSAAQSPGSSTATGAAPAGYPPN